MKLFLILLTIIGGYVISNTNSWFIGLAIVLGVISILISKYRKEKKTLIFFLIIFILALIIGILKLKTPQNSNIFIGIVIKNSEKYVIVSDGFERLYVKTDEYINLFSILKIEGTIDDYVTHPIESAFDFKEYLNNQGIFRQIYPQNISKIFSLPFNMNAINEKILSSLKSEEAKQLINLFIFKETEYNSELYKANFTNNIVSVFTLSGLYIGLIINFIVKIFKKIDKELLGRIIALIFFLPLLIINFQSLILKRIFLYNFLLVVYLARHKKEIKEGSYKLDRFKISNLSFLILLAKKWNVYSLSFIIPFIIKSFLYFSSGLFRNTEFNKKISPQLFIIILIMPILFSKSFLLNPLNLLANLLITPFISVIYLIMYVLTITGSVYVIEGLLCVIYQIFSILNLKSINLNIPPFSQYLNVLYYLCVIFMLYCKELGYKKVFKSLTVTFSLCLTCYLVPFEIMTTNEINFINIGQGDSTLIINKNKTYLVDTGGDIKNDLAINSLIPYFRKRKIYKIDYVFITHYDVDHYYALGSLKKYFVVGDVFDYTNIKKYSGPLPFENLNNFQDVASDENEKSLVLKFTLGTSKILIMGDSDIKIENLILSNNLDVDVDLLKVGHHGSKTSSSLEFLKACSPKEAIISCGYKNKFGHPNKEVLERLNKLNIKIRRTDLEGTIRYKF